MDIKSVGIGAVGMALVFLLKPIVASTPGLLYPTPQCTATGCEISVVFSGASGITCPTVVVSEEAALNGATDITWVIKQSGFEFGPGTEGIKILGSHAGDFIRDTSSTAQRFKLKRVASAATSYEYEVNIVSSLGYPSCQVPFPTLPRIKND